MVIFMGLEVVAVGAVAAQMPGIGERMRYAAQRIGDASSVILGDHSSVAPAPAPRSAAASSSASTPPPRSRPAAAGEPSPMRVGLTEPSPMRVGLSRRPRPTVLPELRGNAEAAASSVLLRPDVLAQVAASLPRRYGDTGAAWHCLFSTATDGFSLAHLLRTCHGAGAVVVLVHDRTGRVFGAYCSELRAIDDAPAGGSGSGFYGTGEAFLFALAQLALPPLPEKQISSPDPSAPDASSVVVFAFGWQRGHNDHFVRADGKHGLVLGAGGLLLDSELRRGASAYCETFSNPPLPRVATPITQAMADDGAPLEWAVDEAGPRSPRARIAAAVAAAGGAAARAGARAAPAERRPSAGADADDVCEWSEVPLADDAAGAADAGAQPTPHSPSRAGASEQQDGGAVEFGVARVEVWAVDEAACRALAACKEHVGLHRFPD